MIFGFAALQLGGLPRVSRADLISGSAEFDGTLSTSKNKDASGTATNSHASDFTHRYNITTELTPYPLLKIIGGSQIKQEFSTVDNIDSISHSTDTVISPFFDIKLGNNFILAGVGYSRSSDTQTTSQTPASTTAQEEYHANLFLKPEGLPDLLLHLSRQNQLTFPANSTTDQLTIGSHYAYKKLDMRYVFTGSDLSDKQHTSEVTQLSQSATANYADAFFNQRVNLFANYNINYIESTTSAGAGGSVDTPLFPVSALSSLNFDPTVGTPDQNVANPFLVDGNLSTSAGINLGVVPQGNSAVNFKWSMGFDFFNTTQINTILVWVDRQLPVAIWTTFTWQIYTRNTNTDNWTLIGVPAKVTFGPFQNSFRLEFNPVSSRFIKVVVGPLSSNVATLNPTFQNPDRIFVTELQGLLNQPAAQLQGTTTRAIQGANFEVRTRLLDTPSLYHNLHFSLTTTSPGGTTTSPGGTTTSPGGTTTSPGGTTTYTLANNLVLDHRFNRIFSTGASVGREDSNNGIGTTTAYTYTASLTAQPLSALRHTLVYSGRIEQSSFGTADNNSFFFTNTAQVYRGIAFNLSAGYSATTSVSGASASSIQFSTSGNFVPRPDLSINISYNSNTTNQSGGNLPSAPISTHIGNAGISYRPFPNLYLLASFALQGSTDQKTVYLQNYNISWSPFPDGNLQFGFNYIQNYSTLNNEKSTSIVPSISWKLMTRATLNLSYAVITDDSALGSTDSDVFSAILRLSF